MDRIGPLAPPHKGLRKALGHLSLALGNTDVSAPAELEGLTALAGEVATILIDHQTDEEMSADQGVIMQAVPFPTLLLWFKYIVLARAITENRALLVDLCRRGHLPAPTLSRPATS